MGMTYKEFESKCIELAGKPIDLVINSWGEVQKPHWDGSDKDKIVPCLYISWCTGGMRGGSCWGDKAEPFVSSDPPEELRDLDVILAHFKPDLSFLQFRALNNDLVKHGSNTNHDYYGNSSDYAFRAIALPSLYEYLKERQWL